VVFSLLPVRAQEARTPGACFQRGCGAQIARAQTGLVYPNGKRMGNVPSVLAGVVAACTGDLLRGATISVTEKSIRVRRLPLLR